MDLLEELRRLADKSVIQWTMYRRYTYVAIKIGGKWYTTATDANTQVQQVIDTADLASALSGALVQVEFATGWKEIL